MPTVASAIPAFIRNLSLQKKITLAVVFTALVPVFIIASYTYNKATASYNASANLIDSIQLNKGKLVIDHSLEKVPHDLRFLSHFHDLKRYLLWHAIGADGEASRWLSNTNSGFYSFMQSNPQYMQLRVIDDSGWEVIRINRDLNGNVSISDKHDLQRKSDSDYFTETMKLPNNQYYISKLNLNREHGKIQHPIIPVIRYALPIIDQNNTRHGIIIINLFANSFLQQLSDLNNDEANAGDSFYLLNQNGFYLYHPDASKTFGFDLDHATTIILEDPPLWAAIQENQTTLDTKQDTYSFKKVYPIKQNMEDYWYIVHRTPLSIHLAELSAFQQTFFILLVFLLIALWFLSRPFIRMLLHPVKIVTKNMQRLERGEINLHTIAYNGNDELRALVDASNGMGMRISEAIAQANSIAQGDFSSEIIPLSKKDKLGTALQSMTRTLQNVADIAESVAKGQLDKEIAIKGEQDRLGGSINKMIHTMRQTMQQANRIAQGDFRSDFEPSSDKDTLGIALKEMTLTLRHISHIASSLATGEYDVDIEIKGEFDQLGRSISHMTNELKANAHENEQQNWLKSHLANLEKAMQNHADTQALANTIMTTLPALLHASHGAFYIMRNNDTAMQLMLEGSYAFKKRKNISNRFKLGEGIVGQCGLEQQSIILTQVPNDYIKIQSGLGEATPQQIIVVPLLSENQLMGVIELATLDTFSNIQQALLEQISDSIGIAIHSVQSAQHTHRLLEESQSLTEELQAQEEELREANTTLELRAEELGESENKLLAQQEELRLNNDELLAKNTMVETQKKTLQASTDSIRKQAEALQQASQYKSDFLSNMSHELRTPLNSLLILSDMLAKNKDGNLSDKQVEFATTIHGSGQDLLELINSILDLAKIEAGKMDLDAHRFPLRDISDAMQRGFSHMAEKKGISFHIKHGDHLPEMIFNDAMRIKQVLKNLLSNALKFTTEGEVVLHISCIDDKQISFAVHDSGVGIAANKLHDIFEAFQQEDGSTSRKYGGTGLGLSICREFSMLLGGHITVQSEQGKGSIFALIIPRDHRVDAPSHAVSVPDVMTNIAEQAIVKKTIPEKSIIDYPTLSNTNPEQALHSAKTSQQAPFLQEAPNQKIPNLLDDDRDHIQANDHIVLIIEDDPAFASIQQGLVQEHGFKAINALRGDHGLMLAQQYIPDAILLDLQLPVLDGISVLERLKQHPKLRHIPVHVISCMDKETENRVLKAGALSFIHKPVKKEELDHVLDGISTFIERDIRQLLIVEDDANQLHAMSALLEANDVHIITASTGADVIKILTNDHVDCMILDLSLPDMSGEEILNYIAKEDGNINQGQALPIIVHTGKDLSEDEVEKLQSISKSIIVKGNYAPERLLAETSLFLHQIESDMPDEKQQKIEKIRELEVDISGKTILLTDDDIRNIYSLSSYLEGHGLHIITARNGLEALDKLKQHANEIDLILMDIMMPEMDGYEAIKAIRTIDVHQNLPIIALTAKAMKGDREQCIEVGASDYITKPVDTEKLISLMRVWLHE